jgi:hypothetical protein
MEDTLVEYIALNIVQKKNGCNSYDFCRFLSSYFGIINCQEIGPKIREKGFVEIEKNNNLNHYTLTKTGEDFISIHKNLNKRIIENTRPDQIHMVKYFLNES